MKIWNSSLLTALYCFNVLWATDARLVLQLSSGMIAERSNAAYLLGASQDPGAVDLLLTQLREEPDVMNRLIIVESIRKLNLPRGYLGLSYSFQVESNPEVKRKMIDALGESGDHQFVEIIHQFLNSQHPADQKSAILALSRISHPSAVQVLSDYLNSSSESYLKKQAIVAIASQGIPEGVDFLVKFGNRSNEQQRVIIAEALAAIPVQNAQPAILSWIMEARHRTTTTRLIKTLQQAGSSSLVPSLYKLLRLRDTSAQIELVEAMLAIDRDSATPYLQIFYLESIQDVDPNLPRLEALQLLRLHKLLRQNLGTVEDHSELYPLVWREDPILYYLIASF